MKELEILGYHVRDKVTQFEGIADSVAFDLYGCVQVSVTPPHTDPSKDKPKGYWHDFARLVKLTDVRVMEPPIDWLCAAEEKQLAVPKGPAEKPSR